MTPRVLDLSNPYGLAPLQRVPVTRSYPAKGERIAYRWSTFGVPHRRLGVPWVGAGTVDALTERSLIIVPASKDVDGVHRVALDVCDAWEWAYAADVTFFRSCMTCKGRGEYLAKPGAVCAACMGRQMKGGKWCDACKGFGFLPGSDLLLDCLDCTEGVRIFDPFAIAKKPRTRATSKTKAYVMPPQTEFYEPPF